MKASAKVREVFQVVLISGMTCFLMMVAFHQIDGFNVVSSHIPFSSRQTRAALFATRNDDAGVFLTTADGTTRASLIVNSDSGNSSLQLFDAGGKGGLTLLVGGDGKTDAGFWTPDGKVRMRLTVQPDGAEWFTMNDANGVDRITCKLDRGGNPKIVLRDADKQEIWHAP